MVTSHLSSTCGHNARAAGTVLQLIGVVAGVDLVLFAAGAVMLVTRGLIALLT